MMKDLRIENLNDFEVVSELIIGVSYLTGEKISSLFNINDINNYNNNLFVCDFENMDYFWLSKLNSLQNNNLIVQ